MRTPCLRRVVALIGILSLPTAALADPILAGNDLFQALPGSYYDFRLQPLPESFFYPGSLPFDGWVYLAGAPVPYAPCIVDPPASVIWLRPLPTDPPGTVPIELVSLSLVSVQPITVHYPFGPDEAWSVHVDLAPIPHPQGTMTIVQDHSRGGTFDSQLPVYPHFVFTNDNTGDTRHYQPIGPIQFGAPAVPWELSSPPPGSCRSNFCPSPFAPVILQGPFGQLVLSSMCTPSAVSAPEGETSTWGRLKTVYR